LRLETSKYITRDKTPEITKPNILKNMPLN